MKKYALLTVFIVVLIDLMGFGIVLPLLPFYASKFNASAVSIGLLYSIYSLAQLIFSPIWGSFSDKIGRRPIMLLSTFGAVCAYILFAFSNSLAVLFLSRMIAGIMGGNISTAQAYVADVTEHKDRAKGMGLIGAAFGIGFIIGPALATFLIHPAFHQMFDRAGFDALSDLIDQNKYALSGLVAAFFSLASFLLVLFKLPESLDRKSINDNERVVRASVFSKKFWQSLTDQKTAQGKNLLLPLMLCMLLLSFGQSSLYSAFPLFCKKVFALPAQKVGLQFVYMGLTAVLIQGGMIRPLEKRFGERNLFVIGSILMVAGLALIPFAVSEKMMTAYLLIMTVGASLNGPTLTSLISKQSHPSKIGSTMGTSQGFSALGRVIGPTWGGALFGFSYRFPFIFTAALILITVFVGIALEKQ